MKVIRAFPPNFAAIAKAFPYVKGRQGIMYAWGDTIYNPSGVAVTPWVKDHEEVHGKRQCELGLRGMPMDCNKAAAIWWNLYLSEPDFRLEEELLAHQAEYLSYTKHNSGGYGSYLDTVAHRLSSALYGNLISFNEARELIENG